MLMDCASLYSKRKSRFVLMAQKSIMRKYFTRVAMLILVTTIAGSSCRKNELDPEPTQLGYSYFPTDSGTTWIYKVDSIVYKSFTTKGTIDTVVYWVKHVIDGSFVDGVGHVNQKVTRYLSSDSGANFVFNNNFSMKVADFRAQVSDSAGTFVKIVFPPSLYQYWDGNSFNAKSTEEYQIIAKSTKDFVQGIQYDSTIDVLHRDEEYFIQKRYGLEKYANHFGLIHKREINYDIEVRDTVRVKKGYDCTYTLEKFIR